MLKDRSRTREQLADCMAECSNQKCMHSFRHTSPKKWKKNVMFADWGR